MECEGGACGVNCGASDQPGGSRMSACADGPQARLLGEYIVDSSGVTVPTQDALKGKIIGLYFSAIWCPPCRAFSPVLAEFQKINSSDFVVVYVSCDRDEAQMRQNLQGKPFFSVPYDSERRPALSTQYRISMIPTLVVINEQGEYITDWGKSAISKNPHNCISEWKSKQAGVTWLQLLNPF